MTNSKSKYKFIKAVASGALVVSSVGTIAAPISASQFTDIEKSSHKESIKQLLQRQIIKGYSDGTFKPNSSVTRGQAAKMIASILDLDLSNVPNPNFSDVPESHEFYPYIAALTNKDVISGYSDETFKPNKTITRGQMAKMLAIGFELKSTKEHPFTDVSAKSEYASYISALFAHEITTGTSDTTFSPRNHVTRGQLASFIIRAEKTKNADVKSEVISGTIDTINGSEISIAGLTYVASNDLAAIIEKNKVAFTKANVKLSVTGNQINSIDTLEISNGTTNFNGEGIQIHTLNVPASVVTIENIKADIIYYAASKEQLQVNNVTAKQFNVKNEPIKLASTVMPSITKSNSNITFTGSTIESLTTETQSVTLSKTNSIIQNIYATNSNELILNGDFDNVTIDANTVLFGTANINKLHFTEQPTNIKLANTLNVLEAVFNERVYAWSDFKKQFDVDQTVNEESSNGDENSNESTNPGGSNSNENPNESTNPDGSNSNENPNESTNPGGSNSNENPNESTNPDGSNSNENPNESTNPDGNSSSIVIDTDKSEITVDEQTIKVSEELLEVITTLKDDIVDLKVSESGIEALTIKTDTFDGTKLKNEQIANLTIEADEIVNVKNVQKLSVFGNVKTISDVQVDHLNITTNEQSIELYEVSGTVVVNGQLTEVAGYINGEITVNSNADNVLINANATTLNLGETNGSVKIIGQYNEVTGGQAKKLEVIPSNDMTFNNVASDEIIISEQPLARAFASLRAFKVAATSTTTVTFTGDYAGRTLTVNRADTVVDVQSKNPFTKITIQGQNNILESNTTLMDVIVSGQTTNITLNAFVKNFNIDLQNPIVLSSTISPTAEHPHTIEHLTITKNTSEDIKGWISLLNVTYGEVTYVGTTDDVFARTRALTFESSVTDGGLMAMGQFTLTVPDKISFDGNEVSKSNITFLTYNNKNSADLQTLLSHSDPRSFATPFTGNKIYTEADVKQIIVYAIHGTEIATSVVDTSSFAPYKLLTGDKYVNLYTRYDTTKTVDKTLGYFLVYKNGELVIEETNLKNKTYDANKVLKFTTTANIDGKNEVFISQDYILFRSEVKNNAIYFPQMIVKTAQLAKVNNNPEMLRYLLTYFAKENNTTIDSLFLGDYVDAIVKEPGKFTTAQSLTKLITDLTPKYQLNIQLGADELLMSSAPLADTASYSTNNVVKVVGSQTAGKIMFEPVGVGKTTVRVTDAAGYATLVNVNVTEQDGQLVIGTDDYSVVKQTTELGTLVDGQNNFRLVSVGSDTYLLPTKLENNFALLRLQSGNYNGYALSNTDDLYTLSAKRAITPVEILLEDLGLTSIEKGVSEQIGVLWNDDRDGIILFPRAASKEVMQLSDATNTTAINIDATEITIQVNVAKASKVVNIQNDLKLTEITNVTIYPQGTTHIHYTNKEGNIQFYSNKSANVAYVFQNSENKKTIVNVTSKLANGVLTVEDPKVVKETLTDANATVDNIEGASVRHDGNTIYATQIGTSIVTLTNGKQYLFDVKQLNNQFTIEYEEIKNVVIEANSVHMTDIAKATSSNPSDTLQVVSGKVIINLASNDTSMITLKSSKEPAETTILYVKKTAAGYEFDLATDVVRTVLDANELGLDNVTKAIGDDAPYARIKVVNGKVYVYGFDEGTRLFRVNDGTNYTAINTEVSIVDGKYKVSAASIKHTLTTTTSGAVQSGAVRLKNGVLYATGTGFDLLGKAIIEIPIAHDSVQAFYTIGLTQNADSKLIKFDPVATTTYKQSISKSDLDLNTLYNPTISKVGNADASNVKATIDGEHLLITVTSDSVARIQVNESNTSDAKAFIYVERQGTSYVSHIEKSDAPISLKDYGYTQTPKASFTKAQIARAYIDENMVVDFYGLAVGQTAYKVTDEQNKHLFVNIDITGTTKRTVTASVVEEVVTGDVTIIEGDAVRLSANKDKLYANKVGTTSIVKLADGSYFEYEVIENNDGQYEITKTELAKAASISKATLGLTGNLTVSGLNSAIASYSITSDGIIVYGNTLGNSSMTISDGTKSVVANVEVTNNSVEITGPIKTDVSSTPTLIHAEDANVVRIDDKNIYAIASGVVELLVGNIIQQVTVTKDNDTYKISTPKTISNAVFTANQLGFATSDSMSIETGYDATNFTVTQVDNKIVAYSKLSGSTVGSTEFIVNASGNRTLVHVKDPGEAAIEHTIAAQPNAITGTTISVHDKTIVREKAGTLYALKEGNTHATVNGYLQAIDVTRENGLLTAVVTPLTLTGTFTTLTETDTTIIDIAADGKTLFAKAIGKTTVKDGDQIFEIDVKNSNGKLTIEKTKISSQTLLAANAQLENIVTATVLSGNDNAVTLSILDKNNTKNGLAIYSNTKTPQNLAVLVSDKNSHKAIINISIDETGTITKAAFVKEEKTILTSTDTAEVQQTTNARGVWNGTTVTTYPIGIGNAALKFANGLVNVVTTKDDTHTVSHTTTVLAHDGFTNALNVITNGAMLKATSNGFYPIAEGNALVHADGKVYSVAVTKAHDFYTLAVSNGAVFTEIATSNPFDLDASTLKGVAVAKDIDEPKLIIYKDGTTTGTSDIVITSGSDKTIYHVKAEANTVHTPVEAKVALPTEFAGATIAVGDAVRLNGDTMYYLAEKGTTLQKNGRLISVDVTRDTNGYFKATPTFVKDSVTVAPASLTNYDIDGTTIYAKSTDVANATETKLIQDPSDSSGVKSYYTTFKTLKNGNLFTIDIDERKAYQYDPTTYDLTTVITTENNTNANVASAKVVGNKLVIIAGDAVGSTVITLKDNQNKQLVINATRDDEGAFNVYPQAAVDSLKFADIDLNTTTHNITAEGFKTDIISVKATKTGLNITAKKAGTTSLQLVQNDKVVGLVNVTVELVNGNLTVTSKAVVFTGTPNELYTNSSNRIDTNEATTYYATATGKTLFKTATGAQYINVTKNETTDQYSVIKTDHSLAEINKSELGLTTLNTAIPATATVGTIISEDQHTLYILGQNTGTTDIVVSDGTSNAVVVAINGNSLSTTVARKAVPVAGTWTSKAPIVATVRDGYIYSQEAGATVLETTLNGHKALMNVVVTRNENRTFNIQPEVVSVTTNDWASVEVLTGKDNIIADGKTLYALQVGTSTVKITDTTSTKVYTVTVSENTNGTFKMVFSQPMTHLTFTATELGLTTLSTPIVNSINGSGVVTAQITNNELVILAKSSGQAEVTVNDGQTVLHLLVKDVDGTLKVEPYISKTTITGATSITKSEGENGIVRFNEADIYALKAGKIIAKTNGGDLYNIVVTRENNQLVPQADRIEYEFTNAQTITSSNSNIVKVEGKKVVAVDYGSATVTVDGKTYKVIVKQDGSIDAILFAENSFKFAESPLADVFTTITSVTSNKGVTNTTVDGSTVTISPKDSVTAETTDIVTVSKGTQTVQLKATIEKVAEGFAVTNIELVSKTLNAGELNGVYAQSILNTSGAAFSSANGILKAKNGMLTVYPGLAGEVHFIVKDSENKQALFLLQSTPNNTEQPFTVQPLTQKVDNNKFGYNPIVLATNGKSQAVSDGSALNVTFSDTNETVFVTTSGENLYHTVLTKASDNGSTFKVADAVVQDALVIDGEITNVSPKLHAIAHNNKTVLYATSETPTTSYFVDPDGIINKVTVGDNYALTKQLVQSESTYNYSTFEFLAGTGDDVVTLKGNKLAVKVTGSGIYKTNTNEYVKVTVTGDTSTVYTVSTETLQSKDLSSLGSTLEVLAPATGVYLDRTTIYGNTTERVAISNGEAIYVDTNGFDDLQPLQLNLLQQLNWSEFESHTLPVSSQFATIDNTTFIPKKLNRDGEIITFTAPSGIQKQLTIKVKDDFTIEATAGKEEVSYQFASSNVNMQLTFSVNIDADFDLLTEVNGDKATFSGLRFLYLETGNNTEYSGTFNIHFPEKTGGDAFTISSTKTEYGWNIPTFESSSVKFNLIP